MSDFNSIFQQVLNKYCTGCYFQDANQESHYCLHPEFFQIYFKKAQEIYKNGSKNDRDEDEVGKKNGFSGNSDRGHY